MKLWNQAITARRPSVGLALVVALHGLFLYALIVGIGAQHPLKTQEPMDATVLEQPVQPADPPPEAPDPTQIAQVEADIPLPPFQFDDTVQTVAEPPPAHPTDAGSGSAEVAAPFIAARVDPRHPLTQPPYPAIEIRGGHEGALTLALLVRTDGRVADARVTRSSGYPLLDEAALIEAKRRWRLLPAMRGSAAVEDWTTLKVVFRLDQR